MLSTYPPGLIKGSQSSSVTSGSYVDTNSSLLRMNLLHKIAALQAKADPQLKRRSAQYNWHCNTKIYAKPKFVPNLWVFVDKLPLTEKANTVDEMDKASYNKIHSRKAGPFAIIKEHPHTLVIRKYGVSITVQIPKVTTTPMAKRHFSEPKHTPIHIRTKRVRYNKNKSKKCEGV